MYSSNDIISNYFTLFTTVSNENDTLETNVKKLNEYYSTDDQKVNYEELQIQWFNTIKNYLYFTYYTLVLTLAILLIIKNTKYTKVYKFTIILCLVVFPFIIAPIEIIIYNIITYIWSFLKIRAYPGNAFS